MIKQIVLASMLAMTYINASHAQSTSLFIVISEATWCKYCKANGERIHSLIDEYKIDKQIIVLSNDLSDEATKSKSLIQLEKMGLADYMTNKKSTGVVYVFNAETKKVMDNFPIKLESDVIVKRLTKNLDKSKS
ncbi:MAG: hypothetical protein JXR07_01420 [Reichenbachiella sp.]